MKRYWVYILASLSRLLYVGVTNTMRDGFTAVVECGEEAAEDEHAEVAAVASSVEPPASDAIAPLRASEAVPLK